jgi:hypothetical protein
MENELKINGKEYVLKTSIKESKTLAKSFKGKRYVIARTYSAGVFAGYLDKRVGQEATLLEARRLWTWQGAASLSQLATDGTSKPNECKFPCSVVQIDLTQVIEVLSVTEKARLSILSVPVWKV